jgi:hypothetical protein
MSRPRLTPGKGPPVPNVQEAGWAPEPVWTQGLEEKSIRLCRGSNLDRPVVQPVSRHYTDWATRFTYINIKKRVKQSRYTPWRRLGGGGGVARTHSLHKYYQHKIITSFAFSPHPNRVWSTHCIIQPVLNRKVRSGFLKQSVLQNAVGMLFVLVMELVRIWGSTG